MNYKISEDKKTLTITVDIAERMMLKRMDEDELQADTTLHEFFEPRLDNSDLNWVYPEDCGDLTSAPMVGYVEYKENGDRGKVLERWTFMDYAVRSPLEDLRDKGEAIFVGGPLT